MQSIQSIVIPVLIHHTYYSTDSIYLNLFPIKVFSFAYTDIKHAHRLECNCTQE